MAIQLNINYIQVIQLVEQLSEAEQNDLIQQILLRRADSRPLTVEEKIRLFDAAKLHAEVNETPSVRREDWYDDDGR